MELGFWKKLKKPIFVIAPMSGVTDEAFRLMFLKYGQPSVFWTEFVSAEGLFSRGREYCLKILKHSKLEHPIVAQIFGSNPDDFEKAAREIAKLGFDGVDINMGCPDRNIEKRGGGAALINNPVLAKQIIRATLRGAGKIPVSVKTRIGYKKNQVAEWIPALLEENIAALTVHLRTRNELYSSEAHWELAKEIVKLRGEISPKTLIIGNGDIKSLEEAHKLAKPARNAAHSAAGGETGMDGVMIGRAVLGNPWFFTKREPSLQYRLNAIIEHAELFENLHKEDIKKNGRFKQFESMKKHFHAYTKGFRGAKELRDNLMKTKTTQEVKTVIENFLK